MVYRSETPQTFRMLSKDKGALAALVDKVSTLSLWAVALGCSVLLER